MILVVLVVALTLNIGARNAPSKVQDTLGKVSYIALDQGWNLYVDMPELRLAIKILRDRVMWDFYLRKCWKRA